MGFLPASKWASGIVERAGREEGRAIVMPSKLFGCNYIASSPQSPREGKASVKTTRVAKKGCRTPFGIRTAQSSRFESCSTLSQLNVSFSRVSVRGRKPSGVGGNALSKLNDKSKVLVWLAMRATYRILLVTALEEPILFCFFDLWARVVGTDICASKGCRCFVLQSQIYSSRSTVPESYRKAT